MSEEGEKLKRLSKFKEEITNKFVFQKISAKELAKQYNTSTREMMDFLRSVGIDPSRRVARLDENKEAIISMYLKGKTLLEIAKTYGTCDISVSRKLKKWDVDVIPFDVRKAKKLTCEKEKLIELYVRKGKTIYEIAKIYGIGTNTVYKKLRDFGIDTSRRIRDKKLGYNILDLNKQEICKMYQKEKSLREIGEKYHVSQSVIGKRLKEWKVPKRDTIGERLYLTKNEIIDKYLDGTKLRILAEQYTVSQTTIWKYLKLWQIDTSASRKLSWLKKHQKKILNLYCDKGYSVAELSNIFNCSSYAIESRLRLWGVTPRNERTSRWLQKLSESHRIKTIDQRREDIVKLYRENHSINEIAYEFNVSPVTIYNRLKEWGEDTKSYISSTKTILAKDGHIVRSKLERAVDDWLYSHGILHSYEVPLPGRNNYVCDFKAGDFWIEVWGMGKLFEYEKRRHAKREYYKKRGLKLIELYPEDIPKNLISKLSAIITSNSLDQKLLENF